MIPIEGVRLLYISWLGLLRCVLTYHENNVSCYPRRKFKIFFSCNLVGGDNTISYQDLLQLPENRGRVLKIGGSNYLLICSVLTIRLNQRTSSTYGEAHGDTAIHYSLLYHVLRYMGDYYALRFLKDSNGLYF